LLVPIAVERSGTKVDWVSVLCHELAHYKRRDYISGLLAELAVCALPWHPLLWWAKRRLVSLSEQACDDWVVALGQSGTDYTESLLDLAPGGQMAFVPAVVASKKGLAGRVTRILKDKCSNPTIGLRWAIVAGITAGLMAIGVAFAQTRPAKPETPSERKEQSTKSLHEAAAAGDIEQVKLLISKGSDVNAKDRMGRTALHSAAEKGHTNIVKFLIDRGADINATSWGDRQTALHRAAGEGHADVVKLLIDRGADVNAKTRSQGTPLHNAASKGDRKTVELLLSKGADINAKDRQGSMPLYWAMTSSAAGRKEVVELLVSKGAKVPAFHLAAYLADIEKLKKCLEEGINVNTPSDCNITALHSAACSGKRDIVEFLISKGADINAKDDQDVMPLHEAAWTGRKDIVELLIDKGVDINAKTDKDKTALALAKEKGHTEIVELLRKHGAKE